MNNKIRRRNQDLRLRECELESRLPRGGLWFFGLPITAFPTPVPMDLMPLNRPLPTENTPSAVPVTTDSVPLTTPVPIDTTPSPKPFKTALPSPVTTPLPIPTATC